jgi:hypothetical protein
MTQVRGRAANRVGVRVAQKPMDMKRAALPAALAAGLALAPGAAAALDFRALFGPCEGDCAVAVYGGDYVENSMNQVLVTDPELPFSWKYDAEDNLVAVAVSRRVGTVLGRLDLEPEAGIARRFGRQDVTEFWGALYFRYRGFPWDEVVTTSVALSTGLNWANQISDVEQERARDGEGSHWMHYFAPEITLALPNHPELELLFRFHHRSGVFGLVSDAHGGAQYGTVGVRVRF